jgi:hypothetical protein
MAARVARQIQDLPRLVKGITEQTERRHRPHALEVVGELVLVAVALFVAQMPSDEVGHRETRGQGIYPYPKRAGLHGQRLGEHRHRRLAGCVDADTGRGRVDGSGGHIDDGSRPAGLHHAQRGLATKQRAFDVDVEGSIDLFAGHLVEAAVAADAGDVGHHIEAAKAGHGRLHQPPEVGPASDVGRLDQGGSAVAAYGLRHLSRPCLVHIGQHNRGTGTCQDCGRSGTYPAGGTGDTRHPAGQVEWRWSIHGRRQ